MHVMFDSVDLAQIPASASAVAGYVDGDWVTFPELEQRWPAAHRVSITIGGRDADFLDVETGDAVPDDAPGWLRKMLQAGRRRPGIYASLDIMTNDITPRLRHARIPRHVYRLWVADWTDQPHIPPGHGACQWTSHALHRNLDESLTLPGFFT